MITAATGFTSAGTWIRLAGRKPFRDSFQLSTNIDIHTSIAVTCNPVDHTGPNYNQIAVAIIPARYDSTRLPGKPLLQIGGKPLVLWVVERALSARSVSRALVATDDARILDCVTSAGFEAVMTRER